jgi:hypothetical protein
MSGSVIIPGDPGPAAAIIGAQPGGAAITGGASSGAVLGSEAEGGIELEPG